MNIKRLLISNLMIVSILLGAKNIALAQQSTNSQTNLSASSRLSLPGEQHRWLNPLIGTWTVEMLVWPAPGVDPIVSKEMTATRTWILDGRYLREDLSGKFAGNPSNRVAILSYNNLEERFELVTIDTFEPGQMWYASHSKSSPSKIELIGDNVEAGFGEKPTGRKRSLRFEFEILPNRSVERIYVKYPSEKEFLFVEQRFTRTQP
jgi:hypothetical protein